MIWVTVAILIAWSLLQSFHIASLQKKVSELGTTVRSLETAVDTLQRIEEANRPELTTEQLARIADPRHWIKPEAD